jgi:hypothetical protein
MVNMLNYFYIKVYNKKTKHFMADLPYHFSKYLNANLLAHQLNEMFSDMFHHSVEEYKYE